MSMSDFSPAKERALHRRGIDALFAITAENQPELIEKTRFASNELGIPMPNLYEANHNGPKAIMVDDHAVVLSKSLMQSLSPDEIAAVVTHELANNQLNNDHPFNEWLPWMSGMASTVLAETLLPAKGAMKHLASVALGCLVAGGINWTLDSRQRYQADAIAAQIIGRDTVISALQNIQAWHKENDSKETLSLAFRTVEAINEVFNHYPPLESRVERLKRERAQPTDTVRVV